MDRKQIKREAPEGFDQSWLSCRAPYDAMARRRDLEEQAWSQISRISDPVVLDLGCGSGNNVLFLAKRWPGVSGWAGIDHDEHLIHEASRRTQEDGINFTGVVADLLDLDHHLKVLQPNLLVANAVFDLFTAEMMTAVLSDLKKHRMPLLTTLNYTSMEWADPLPHESAVIQLYEAHMVRPRPSGNGLGPTAPNMIGQIVESLGGMIDMRESVWEIPASDAVMQRHLLGFMSDSVSQMISSETIQEAEFRAWLDSRTIHLSDLRVTHQDIFISWA